MPTSPLYVFIDESGDFNFSPSGSKFYLLTATITHSPWEMLDEAYALKQRILSREMHDFLSQEYLDKRLCHRFHACEDKQVVRDDFFSIIKKMKYIKAHSVVIRKNRANPAIRDPHRFYPQMTSSLMDYIFKKYIYSKLCIFIDGVPVNRQKKIFTEAVKSEITAKQPTKEFNIYFTPSASSLYLQVSDYINWAIFRKWENGDERSYKIIEDLLGSPELDMFRKGTTEYYSFKKGPLI